MNRRQGSILFVTFALYLVFGGSVFMTLENNEAKVRVNPTAVVLDEFVDLLKLDGDDNINLTTNEQWNEFVTEVYSNFSVSLEPNGTVTPWTLYDGVFLCLTVVTTVGYGNISPSTEFGRFFCVMYGFIGIPLAGILFAAIGDFFSTKLLKAHERTKSRSSSPRRALIISTIMYLIPGFLMFLILPAGVFMILEKWSFIQGFYYSFVTLTTIGFGDFVAATTVGEYQWIYKICLMLWITFGLGYLAMILNFIAKAMKSKHVKKIEKTVSKNLKHTQEALSKEMEYVLKTMNEFYTNKLKVKHGLHKLKRTSSCPSLDRPVPKVKKSSSAGSFLDVKCDSPFSPTENPTSFIFDLAMALACGDLNDPVKETETRSRAGSIAQLLTMALLPQTLDSGAPPETNLTRERSSTRRSLPPLQDFLLKNNNSTRTKYLPQNSVKHKKSVSLLEGLLFPPELAMNLKTPAKEVDNSKLRRSDRFIADATDGSLSGINKTKDNLSVGSKLSRSVSNPGTGTFRYTDRYMDNSTNNSFCNTYKSSHHHLEPVTEHGNHVSPKCNWIIGSPSADDVPSMALNNSEDEENPKQVYDNFDHNHHLTSQTLQRIPSSESQHIKLVPSISVIFRPETEMSTVIEEDNETSSQGSVTNLLNVENGSDQGISSQETVSIDITEPEPECQNEFTSTTDDDCQESGSICVASMESDLNDSTHM